MAKESKCTKRLQAIGETRWWSKDKALNRVFGSFGKPPNKDDCLYIRVLLTLAAIGHDERTDGQNKAKAKGQIDNLLKYETILTAYIFLRVFRVTTRLSKFLQTSGIDLLTAKRLTVHGAGEIKSGMIRDFDAIKVAADSLVTWARKEIVGSEFEHQIQHLFW